MSDEVGSAALSAGQKTVEVSAELIKILAPLAESFISKLFHKSVDGINTVSGLVSALKSKGTVTNKELFSEAQKAGSGISTTSNFLGSDAEQFVQKAKQYNIPVAVVGNGDRQTVEFLDRDKGIVEQIQNELMQERLREAPQSVKCFTVSENSVTAIKAAFEENGIECQFMQSNDGKIKCIYPAENAEQVAVIKEDYKQMHKEVADALNVERGENGITVSDNILGQTIGYTPVNKEQTIKLLREQFGYSAAKADLAANKICRDLGLDSKQFLSGRTQTENINSFKTNIRYQSDDLTIRDMRFNAVNFKDGNETHIVIQNGDKAAALTPSKMFEAEMKKICINTLGMSEYQADKAAAKAEKIHNQVMSQIAERTTDEHGISQEIGIERNAANSFTVFYGDKSKTYNFSTVGVEDKISRDFGIPKENAGNIVAKAQKQSVLQNKIKNSLKKKKIPVPEAPVINKGKGLKH